MFLDASILLTVAVAGILLWSPGVRGAMLWRAMTTPLASIIGSGFLVLGPILVRAYGAFAPLVMAALCGAAYAFGAAIRYTMTKIDRAGGAEPGGRLETLASWSLGLAYIVSVAYYLNLFGAFGVSLTPFDARLGARILTSAVFAVILSVGWTRGFAWLERMEYASVSAKLAIIAGLMVGLAAYFGDRTLDGSLVRNMPNERGWPALALAFGLIITVQGFETSRYLIGHYDARTCIRSMRMAQLASGAIYLVYILLLAYTFRSDRLRISETAVIDMMAAVAPSLPILLVAAALAAQFSAAVADTSGSGGLIEELSAGRIESRQAYALLAAIGLLLTWTSDVFELIVYASRAFAIYYAIQSVIAARAAWRDGARARALGFAGLAGLGGAIVIFGRTVEG